MNRRRVFLASTTTSVFLALVCFLLVLAISNDFQRSWDLTEDRRHSFSPQTVEFMEALREPVKFYAFVDPAGDSSVVESLLERYQRLAPRFFSYEIVDLQKNPTLAETLQVRSYGQGVLEKGGRTAEGETPRRERVLTFDEASITNGLVELNRGESKTAYFLVGHGERLPDQNDPRNMSQLVNSLRTEGYQSKSLKLAEISEVPEDAALLVMAGPTGELLDKEQSLLEAYLKEEGKLLFLAEIGTPGSYVEMLSRYGFTLGDAIIIDEVSASVGAEPVTPIGTRLAPDHPITRGFKNLTAFTLARPVWTGEVGVEGKAAELTVLVETEETAYLTPLKELLKGEAVEFSSEGKTPGSYPLAVAAKYTPVGASPAPEETPAEGRPDPVSSRIVVLSSVDAFSNSGIGMAGNRDFVLNAINWLAESENQITVRVRDPKVQPLSITWRSQMWMYFIFCILLPLLSALTGILVAYYRRQGAKA